MASGGTRSDAERPGGASGPRTAEYRCVCGAAVPMDEAAGGVCAACGRRYASEILRSASVETVTVPHTSPSVPAGLRAPQDEAHDPWVGRNLEHFRIIERLGHGGMGTVYRALDESLQRYVALKVIRRAGPASADTHHMKRMLEEAVAQARLNHPNVVHVFYVGREAESPFLAMELVDGPTLAERLAKGSLPFDEVVDTAIQMAGALEHSAKFDIVHGDVKPGNILMADGHTAKLSDFGLARRLSEASPDPVTIVGTPNYLSPEAAQGEPLDVRSDMYSLGVTLFEMTFGRLPYTFSGESIEERLAAHQESPVRFPDPWPRDVPEAWRDVLARLLWKDPGGRYQSYRKLIADLETLRPASRPRAGRVPRGLAWLVDLGLCFAAQQVLFAAWAVEGVAALLEARPALRLIAALSSGLPPLLGSVLQARFGTTVGKKLFQIRLVDRHGVPPGRTRLAVRAAAQLLPLWAVTAKRTLEAVRMTPLGDLVVLAAVVVIAVDCGFALFRPRGRSLHDLLFETDVALDAPVAPPGRAPRP